MPALRSSCLTAIAVFALASEAFATNVTIETELGSFEIELFDEETPGTVENFLNYVRSGAYGDSIIHRSVPGFVIQGGSYFIEDGLVQEVVTNDPIVNEPGIPNTRGTIAMAKIANDPDSATSGWFINLLDNDDLNSQNGGFTVFGRVVGDGMDVVDAIAELPVFNLGVPGFTTTPLINYEPPNDLVVENFVRLNVEEASDFLINAGLNDAWFNPETAGQGLFFTVFPEQGLLFLSWFTYDTERPADDVTAVVGEPGHRWLTAIGSFDGNRATLDATLTSGGVFDSAVPAVETDPAYGTITVTFSDCDNALVSYDFPGPGVTGDVAVERVVKDNVALCEALQTPAD